MKLSKFLKKNSTLNSFLFFILFLVGFTVIALLFSPHHRLYQVDVETGFVKLHLSDSIQNRWDISDFEVCQPNEVEISFDEESEGSPMFECFAQQDTDDELILNIKANTYASIDWSMSNGLQIELSALSSVGSIDKPSGEKQVLGNKVLFHRSTDNLSDLTLTFEGGAQIGTEAKLGSSNLLRSGVIQVYEKVKYVGKRYLLGEINLGLGDAITFIQSTDGTAISAVKGIMRVSSEETGYEKGIHVIAYTAASTEFYDNNTIEVTRFGTEGYTFSPTIWNRIQADPLTSIFITIFGALLLLMEIISKWKERNKK